MIANNLDPKYGIIFRSKKSNKYFAIISIKDGEGFYAVNEDQQTIIDDHNAVIKKLGRSLNHRDFLDFKMMYYNYDIRCVDFNLLNLQAVALPFPLALSTISSQEPIYINVVEVESFNLQYEFKLVKPLIFPEIEGVI